MFKKIKQWFKPKASLDPTQRTYTYDQVLHLMEEAKKIGVSDGRKEGLALARHAAARSLSEILKEQNK